MPCRLPGRKYRDHRLAHQFHAFVRIEVPVFDVANADGIE